ncbi:hypothetical protein Pcinc_036339 [Petrolisthes cinctipes]|uniref:Uncharacterized protein n=1 Tax=Petrolisthes cinctipes TaxID=88211 RepID=A0AAE1BZ04_PETCI|nr:hypothetical protein Pcinc_036339 [Petrolisthes cinctipes]
MELEEMLEDEWNWKRCWKTNTTGRDADRRGKLEEMLEDEWNWKTIKTGKDAGRLMELEEMLQGKKVNWKICCKANGTGRDAGRRMELGRRGTNTTGSKGGRSLESEGMEKKKVLKMEKASESEKGTERVGEHGGENQ